MTIPIGWRALAYTAGDRRQRPSLVGQHAAPFAHCWADGLLSLFFILIINIKGCSPFLHVSSSKLFAQHCSLNETFGIPSSTRSVVLNLAFKVVLHFGMYYFTSTSLPLPRIECICVQDVIWKFHSTWDLSQICCSTCSIVWSTLPKSFVIPNWVLNVRWSLISSLV